jgi:hypothetical protein
MQLRYIRPFSQYKRGDVVEFPDGAAFDEFYLELVPPEVPVPAVPVTVPAPAVGAAPKEM